MYCWVIVAVILSKRKPPGCLSVWKLEMLSMFRTIDFHSFVYFKHLIAICCALCTVKLWYLIQGTWKENGFHFICSNGRSLKEAMKIKSFFIFYWEIGVNFPHKLKCFLSFSFLSLLSMVSLAKEKDYSNVGLFYALLWPRTLRVFKQAETAFLAK